MKTNVMYYHTSDLNGPKILTQCDDEASAARAMREIAMRPAGATIIESADGIDVYCDGYGFSYFLEAADAQPAEPASAASLLTPEQDRKVANLIAAGTPHRRAIRIVTTGSFGTGLLRPDIMRRLGRIIAQYEADHNLAPAA